jgi:carboxyl-terminal processing protease
VLLVEGADCDVQARFRDGALSRFAVAHLLMGDRELALDLDTRPVAGLGVPFRVGDDGVTIGAPMPGSPASAAGLVEGDVLVEVDGTGVAGVEPYDFVNLATGVEGTTVTLQVRGADGGERTVRLVRARISADDEAGD